METLFAADIKRKAVKRDSKTVRIWIIVLDLHQMILETFIFKTTNARYVTLT